MNKQYKEAINIAKNNLADLERRGEEAKGVDALEYINSLMTPEEIAESDLRVAMMIEFVKIRKEKGLTQQQLSELSGVKQPAIARLENSGCVPKMSTLNKLLMAMGKRIQFVDI